VNNQQTSIRRPTPLVGFILILASLTTIATSEEGDIPTLGSWWAGAISEPVSIRFDLGEGGASWLSSSSTDPTFLELYLVSRDSDQDEFPEAIWTLKTVDGLGYTKTGMFMGNAPGNSRGSVAWLGQVCRGDQVNAEESDCLPCDLANGCVFEVDLSLCSRGEQGDRAPDLYIRLTDEDGRVRMCSSGCGRDGYISSSLSALERNICDDSPEVTPTTP